jgi:cation:H+ antiporter
VYIAHLFVDEVSELARLLHFTPLILSLLIIPIATELPEKCNSVMWIHKGKDNLALANMTGAMVFQSAIPGAVGLLFTPWTFSGQALLSIILCTISAGLAYMLAFTWGVQKTAWVLLLGGIFYMIFVGYSFQLLASAG